MRTWKKIGVIGAGNMGSGIAQKIATEGFQVALVDVSAAAAAAGIERIRKLLHEGIERRLFTSEVVERILTRFTAGADFALLADCDLVIEAVFEDRQVKADVFARAAAVVKPDAILATNTSSFKVSDLAASVPHPERFIGLHYFYHPAKNRLVEVIAHEGADREVWKDAWRFQELIGKTPIESADSPGFIVNRYFVPWLNEAVRMLDEGVAGIATIEAAAKEAFAIGMGPFELMNVTGIPIAMHAATTLGQDLGSFYAPSPLLMRQVESKAPWDLGGSVDDAAKAVVAERLLATVFMVAGHMIDERVCTLEDADIGARVGLRWRAGPFELMNEKGAAASLTLVQALATRWRLAPPRCLSTQAAAHRPFPIAMVDLHVESGIATVRINRPDAMNALNPEVVRQLAARFDEAVARADTRCIVLAGSGKAFVAGADVKWFVDMLDANAFPEIYEFTRLGQELFRRIDECPKLVICKLDGLSLGGGCELALCADIIIASERGSMGFPETAIGIYPGLGGTQRTMRRVGSSLARYLIFTGLPINATEAQEIGLIDEVVAASQIDQRILEIADGSQQPTRMMNPGRWKPVIDLFKTTPPEKLLAIKPEGDADLERLQKRVRTKAPIALAIADLCIETGKRDGIEAGLACELANLERIFSTADAYEGLSSLVAGRRPVFKNA